jgi:hypothetical protein
MASRGRALVVVVVVVGIFALALLLVTAFVPPVRDLARSMAGSKLGTFGLFLAGLAAPIVYVFKRVAEWFGTLGGETPSGRAIAERSAAIERRMDELRREVAAVDAARQRDLEAYRARLATIEDRLAGLRQRGEQLDEHVARLQAAPARQETDDQMYDRLSRDPSFGGAGPSN